MKSKYLLLLLVATFQITCAEENKPLIRKIIGAELYPHYKKGRTDRKKNEPATPSMVVVNYSIKSSVPEAVASLLKNKVSIHYIIDRQGQIFKLIHPDDMAFHAGHSSWKPFDQTRTFDVNAHSIGVIFINQGHVKAESTNVPGSEKITDKPAQWFGYTQEQIDAFVSLCRNLKQEYIIADKDIVGHGEVAIMPPDHKHAGALGRKVGPGPLFPWKYIAEQSVGLYHNPDIDDADFNDDETQELNIEKLQEILEEWGYNVQKTNECDHQTKQAILQMQMHHDPEHIDGQCSCRTMQILESLIQKSKQQ